MALKWSNERGADRQPQVCQHHQGLHRGIRNAGRRSGGLLPGSGLSSTNQPKFYASRQKHEFVFFPQDSPQTIGYGVTISAPHMHAHALDLLSDHLKVRGLSLDPRKVTLKRFSF